MAKRKLKMTKKAIAARRRYRAKRAGVPTRRKNVRPTGTKKQVRRRRKTGTRKRGHDIPSGAGVGGTYGGIKRGKRNSPKGAGFWEDVGGFFENVGRTALNLLPMML